MTEIEPDTKDWTWVLDRPCAECGYDAATVVPEDVAATLRTNVADWTSVLARPSGLRERPTPTVWSPLEYACHIRDVYRLFDQRLQLMLAHDDPMFANWDQDATAVAERYGEQDPATVAGELTGAGTALADRFAALAPEHWTRTGRRSDGAVFTVDSFARYLLHDVLHHLGDVRPHN